MTLPHLLLTYLLAIIDLIAGIKTLSLKFCPRSREQGRREGDEKDNLKKLALYTNTVKLDALTIHIIWTATAVAARFAISIRVILVVHHKFST